MALPGRFFGDRDTALVSSFIGELMDDIVQTEVTLFKACADATNTNIYGESNPKTGKQYYPGIAVTALIDRAGIVTSADDFGPDRSQNVAFMFRESALQAINFFPQTGDLVFFNHRYHEIDDVVQEQFLAGVPEKSLSIICNTHYTRLSKVDVVQRQT